MTVAGAIDFPPELLQSHEDGNLVFFCGAGVSQNAGLPLFGELATTLLREFLPTPAPEHEEALLTCQFDRLLYLLERDLQTPRLRERVREILTVSARELPLHRAILELSRRATSPERFRLVTTNFDDLFEQAALISPQLTVRSDVAPRLAPLDVNRWDSLVYLHGRIHSALDTKDLVLTSADFGRAYLIERWASRFATSLFSNYSVLLIGYSANDPVMRYLLDAFADTSRAIASQAPHCLFALADYPDETTRSDVENRWRAKGLTPIPYLARDGDYSALTASMTDWARRYRKGRWGKRSRLRQLLEPGPRTLAGGELSELRWMLSDSHSLDALYMAEEDPEPSLGLISAEWLSHLAALELMDLQRFAEQSLRCHELPAATDWVRCPLVGPRQLATADAPLGPRVSRVCHWISLLAADTASAEEQDSNSERVLQWILDNGGYLHSWLHHNIAARLKQATFSRPVVAAAWNAVLDPARNVSLVPLLPGSYFGAVMDRIRAGDVSSAAISVIHATDPFLHFKGSTTRKKMWALANLHTECKRELSLVDILDPEIALRCDSEGQLSELERAIASSPAKAQLFRELALPATLHVDRALRLLYEMEPGFAAFEDIPYETIGQFGVSHRYASWTFLADLAWTAGCELDSARAPETGHVYQLWVASRYRSLQRLALKAATEWSSLDASQREQALTHD